MFKIKTSLLQSALKSSVDSLNQIRGKGGKQNPYSKK